jgi:zinc protease
LRIALHELRQLIDRGLTAEQFESTRQYLMKSVFLMTATQDAQIGYAIDSHWYGIPEFTTFMRDRLRVLTLDDVKAAIRKHLSAKDLRVVMIAKDAQGLRERLLADEVSPVKYDAPPAADVLEEDKVIGAEKLGLAPQAVTIVPVEDVFAK